MKARPRKGPSLLPPFDTFQTGDAPDQAGSLTAGVKAAMIQCDGQESVKTTIEAQATRLGLSSYLSR